MTNCDDSVSQVEIQKMKTAMDINSDNDCDWDDYDDHDESDNDNNDET